MLTNSNKLPVDVAAPPVPVAAPPATEKRLNMTMITVMIKYDHYHDHDLNMTITTIRYALKKTSQELRMLSSVILNCQVTMIVMDSGSQL